VLRSSRPVARLTPVATEWPKYEPRRDQVWRDRLGRRAGWAAKTAASRRSERSAAARSRRRSRSDWTNESEQRSTRNARANVAAPFQQAGVSTGAGLTPAPDDLRARRCDRSQTPASLWRSRGPRRRVRRPCCSSLAAVRAPRGRRLPLGERRRRRRTGRALARRSYHVGTRQQEEPQDERHLKRAARRGLADPAR
jgi:hypothetical protein